MIDKLLIIVFKLEAWLWKMKYKNNPKETCRDYIAKRMFEYADKSSEDDEGIMSEYALRMLGRKK